MLKKDTRRSSSYVQVWCRPDASEQVRVWYLWYQQVPTPPSVFREDLCSTEEEEGGSDNICIYPS